MRLVLWNLINLVVIWSNGGIHATGTRRVKKQIDLSDDEINVYTNHQHIEDYDIFSPTFHKDAIHKRSIDSLPANPRNHEVKFNAFGDEFHLKLERNAWLQRRGLTVDRLGKDGVIQRERLVNGDCHYYGRLISHTEESSASISTCKGLRGVISHGDSEFYIKPLEHHHASRIRRDSDIRHDHPHIIYKRRLANLRKTTPREQDNPTEFCASEDPISSNSEIGNHTRAPSRLRSSMEDVYVGQKYMEFLVMIDKSMVEFHGDDAINYTMTLMNIVSRRFAEPSLGVSIRLSITKFIILDTDTPMVQSLTGHNSSLNVQANGPQLLEEFCRWQAGFNPINDAHPEHWDIATFITRKDLFKLSGTYRDTNLLGRAYIGTTCQRSLQCSVNQDDGLTTGSVVAHETGHNLNLHHDPDYGCNNGHHVMSSARPVGVESFKWSVCSAQQIKIFLHNRLSFCLNDAPSIDDPEVDLLPVNDLPGRRYSLRAQCQLAYGASSSVCSQSLCGSLGCQESGFCHYAGIMIMEGTTCGPNKWCVSGDCVPTDKSIPGPVDGGWSDWEAEFSECSRSCGTGVRVRRRSCNNPTPVYGGLACPGEGREVQLCNMMPCHNVTLDDYKNEQCAATNRFQFNNQYYTWRAFLSSLLKGNNVCKLQCISNANFYALREPGKYADGTTCWHDETGEESLTKACVDGLCKEFGCDGKMGSGLNKDVCGKCDGSGRTCKRQVGRIRNVGAVHDFKTFLQIPVNSTGIKIMNQNLRYTHMSVEADGEVVFRGEMFIPPLSQRYSHSGMIIKYLADAFRNKEQIWVLSGPTTAVLDVSVILLHNPRYLGSRVKPDITWEYYAPIREPVRYYWQHEILSGCSATCGGGIKIRRVYCVENIGGETAEVSELFCDSSKKPSERRSCQTQPCPVPVWVVGQWSLCSATCDVGRRKRAVACLLNTTGEAVPELCDSNLRPATEEQCVEAPCPRPAGENATTTSYSQGPKHMTAWSTSTSSTTSRDKTITSTFISQSPGPTKTTGESHEIDNDSLTAESDYDDVSDPVASPANAATTLKPLENNYHSSPSIEVSTKMGVTDEYLTSNRISFSSSTSVISTPIISKPVSTSSQFMAASKSTALVSSTQIPSTSVENSTSSLTTIPSNSISSSISTTPSSWGTSSSSSSSSSSPPSSSSSSASSTSLAALLSLDEDFNVDISCNGLTRRKHGYIDQINSPTGGDSCTAVIVAPTHKNIVFTIKQMYINCDAGESLEIRIGEERRRLCGKQYQITIETESNVIAIEHKTHRQGHGYQLLYHLRKSRHKNECDKLITDRKTIITSPAWPSKYQANMNCTYRFIGDPSKKITFRVKIFKLQGKEPRCKHDKLEMVDLLSGDKLIRCGTSPSKYSVRLSGYDGLMRFTSDDSVQLAGFKIIVYIK